MRFDVDAPYQRGRDYQILLASKVGTREWFGHVDVPFELADAFVQLSQAIGATPSKGVSGFAGKLDAKGHAVAFLPGEHLANLDVKLMATVVIMDDRTNAGTARARSRMVPVQPR